MVHPSEGVKGAMTWQNHGQNSSAPEVSSFTLWYRLCNISKDFKASYSRNGDRSSDHRGEELDGIGKGTSGEKGDLELGVTISDE